MKIAFDNEDKRYKAYGKVDIGVNGVVKEVSKSELNSLVSDSFEGGWKENKEYFKLDIDNTIVFDESYQPDSGGS